MPTVTCHTDGCSNAEIPIEVAPIESIDELTGETIAGVVICGPCGVQIVDVR